MQIELEEKKRKEIKNFELKTNNKGRKPENKKEKNEKESEVKDKKITIPKGFTMRKGYENYLDESDDDISLEQEQSE